MFGVRQYLYITEQWFSVDYYSTLPITTLILLGMISKVKGEKPRDSPSASSITGGSEMILK